MAVAPVTRHLEAVPGRFPSSLVADAATEAEREDIRIGELSFRQLRTGAEIERIKHLREEIQLPASALADPGFQTREKKETREALSALSSIADNSSARSASCQWRQGSLPARTCSSDKAHPARLGTAGK
jgi:hypothetical protein